MMRRQIAGLLLLVSILSAGCGTFGGGGKPNPTPTPTPTPTPVQTIAIFTVEVNPAQAIVQVGSQAFATRPNGIVEEEFKAGDVLPVTARAEGFVTSEPVQVTMVGGRMPTMKITLVPVPNVVPVIGTSGRFFTADGKVWSPALVSALDLLSKPPEHQGLYLDWVKRTGFDGIRVFAGELQPWAPQTPESARAALPGLLDRVASRGLVIEVTALTGTATGYDAKDHLTKVADILAGRRGVILELANEITNGSQDTRITDANNLRAWGIEIVRPRGLLWAVGATDTDEPCPPSDPPDICRGYLPGEYPAGGGDYSTAHLDRGRPSWNNVRRVREIFAIADDTRRPAMNNEPMGADELDGRQTGKQRWNDPALFFVMGALERAFSIGGVHHSEAGRYSQLPGPVQQQCAEAYIAGHRAVEKALGGQVGSYRNVNHVGSPVIDINVDGIVRAYSFIVGDIGVTVAVGMAQNHGIVWGNGYSPTGEVDSRTGQDGRRAVVMTVKR